MPLPALSLPRRPPARAVGACACVLALLGGGWLWLRDSGLVAVDQVSVTGLSGTEAPRVRAALEGAARDMTTLHVRPDQLRTAVEPYPAIMAVDAHAGLPARPAHRRPRARRRRGAGRRLRPRPRGRRRHPAARQLHHRPARRRRGLPAARRHAGRQARAARRRAAGGRAARAARQGQPRVPRPPRA